MKQVTTWWDEMNGGSRRWLLLGKGPSFETRDRFDLRPYTTVGINHVAREMRVDVTSVVNYEVLADCGTEIARNSRFLLMPRFPHSIPGDYGPDLETYFEMFPFLERLSREGRLIWYNLSSDPVFCDPLAPGPPLREPFIVKNGPLSVCILFNLLGALGARQVRMLGTSPARKNAIRRFLHRVPLFAPPTPL